MVKPESVALVAGGMFVGSLLTVVLIRRAIRSSIQSGITGIILGLLPEPDVVVNG